ncbi:MAG: hypothetical protein KC561_14645, partial [Myxococcales bacterium]|nr:hypothetical protein [Myxococcales bacterium]
MLFTMTLMTLTAFAAPLPEVHGDDLVAETEVSPLRFEIGFGASGQSEYGRTATLTNDSSEILTIRAYLPFDDVLSSLVSWDFLEEDGSWSRQLLGWCGTGLGEYA